MNFDDSLSEKWERAASARQQDFDDLQREVAGVDVGRLARFLPDDVRNPEAAEKRKAEHQQQMLTRLQMMMRDPEYAALHENAVKTLRQVSTELDQINEDARRLWEADTKAIAQIDERAARDSHGRAVFMNQDGRCCTSLTTSDSLCESMPLDALHEQAITRPLSHDELVHLQRIAAQAGVAADLGGHGHDLACAA